MFVKELAWTQIIVRYSYTVVPNTRTATKVERTVLPISRGQTLEGGDHVYYHLTYSLPFDTIDWFDAKLPALVKGEQVVVPSIHFNLREDWSIYPINC